MPRAKKTVTKKTETVAEVDVKKLKADLKKELLKSIRDELQSEIQNALLDVEITPSETNIDYDEIFAKINEAVKSNSNKIAKQLESISRGETQALTMSNNLFDVTSSTDGIVVKRTGQDDVVFTLTKNGALAFGNKSPRTLGLGTAHFRMKGAGKSPIPTNGPGSTRGVIIEGDGDDANTFSFRALSTGNRQGFNVGSTGKLSLGTNETNNNNLVLFQNNYTDINGLNVFAKSKYFDENVLVLESASDLRNTFNFIDVVSNKNQDIESSVFRVNGSGETYTHKGFFSNSSGYAELFEWADGNNKNEDRVGLTVALNSQGKLIDANDDNEQIIGVVVDSAAIIGNSGWNMWQGKSGERVTERAKYKIVEWVDDTGKLTSEYVSSFNKEFAFPKDAVIYESDYNGKDLTRPVLSASYDATRQYTPRLHRGWTLVALKGTVTMYKGQNVRDSWIKIRDLSDELEQRILL